LQPGARSYSSSKTQTEYRFFCHGVSSVWLGFKKQKETDQKIKEIKCKKNLSKKFGGISLKRKFGQQEDLGHSSTKN